MHSNLCPSQHFHCYPPTLSPLGHTWWSAGWGLLLDGGLLLDPLLPPGSHSLPSTQQLAWSLKMYHSLIPYLLRIFHCLPTHSKFEQKLLNSSEIAPSTSPHWPDHFPLLSSAPENWFLGVSQYSKFSPTFRFCSQCSVCLDSSAQMLSFLTHLYTLSPEPGFIGLQSMDHHLTSASDAHICSFTVCFPN